MDKTQTRPIAKYDTTADFPELPRVAGYMVQVESTTRPGLWRTCGEDYWEPIKDVTEAEAELNRMRNNFPHRNYRLIREVILTEVVHA